MIYFNCKFTQAYSRIIIEFEDGQVTRHLTDLSYKHDEDMNIIYVKDLKNQDLYFPHEDFKNLI